MSSAKGRSWWPVLIPWFHGAGSVCLPSLGFSSQFWKACSAYLHVQVDTLNLLVLLGVDSIGSGVISCQKDWNFIRGSFQCFRKNILLSAASGDKLIVKMAAEPNRSTIICASCGLSQAFNHEETGLYLGFPKEDSWCRPKKFYVSQAVACKCHSLDSPAHMSQGTCSLSFFLPWLWVNKMVKSICEEAAEWYISHQKQ